MEEDNLATLKKLVNNPFGIFFVTGSTGSGKTTTLYAMLKTVSTPMVNIITLEDPVEYRLENINQSQINPKTGFNWSDGLRTTLRQDPDVIMPFAGGESGTGLSVASLAAFLCALTAWGEKDMPALPFLCLLPCACAGLVYGSAVDAALSAAAFFLLTGLFMSAHAFCAAHFYPNYSNTTAVVKVPNTDIRCT